MIKNRFRKYGAGFLASLLLFLWLPLAGETWTILVYMAADNNLWQNAIANINSMESVDLPSNLTVVVQSDMPDESPYPGGQRRLIGRDNSPYITSRLLENMGAINSGDPQTLNGFARWGFHKYPSQKRALVIWGHGNSWYKAETDKWICPDADTNDLINVYNGELKEALSGLPQLDILLFDACSMQSVEVICEVGEAAERVIGSEEQVPAKGFPYEVILPLFTHTATADEIAQGIVDAYLEAYDYEGIYNPNYAEIRAACSAVKTEGFEGFMDEFARFVAGRDGQEEALLAHREGCWQMNDGNIDVDIGQYLKKVMAESGDGTLVQDATLLLDSWQNLIIKAGSINLPVEVGTAALWFPWHRQYFDGRWQMYAQLDFAQTMWLSMLNRAFGKDDTPPEAPVVTSVTQSLGSVITRLELPLDPDRLEVVVDIYDADGVWQQGYRYQTEWGCRELTLRLPMQSSGTLSFSCQDKSGNQSEVAVYNYVFDAHPLKVEVHPNPLMSKTGGEIRWYIPEGEEATAELGIYNLKGQKVYGRYLGDLPAGEGKLLREDWLGDTKLPAGIYFIQLRIGKQICGSKLTIL